MFIEFVAKGNHQKHELGQFLGKYAKNNSVMNMYCVSPCNSVSQCIKIVYQLLRVLSYEVSIGGSRGRARRTPPKGSDSFVSTYKMFET